SENGILHNYSGGVKYRKTITLTAEEAAAIKALDLGKVIATAELSINGKVAGVRVAPPWQLDVSGLFVAGENTIEVTVYNTLSNHYQTIHNLYRGEPTSGLLGPVRLLK
ncbi:MAG: glycosylhydrolase-like jelly roll fold domain-containing protein, partial [Akkermansiaceae bacterium]